MEEPARSIQTLDDVRAVLGSDQASQTELLECAEVAKRFQDGPLRRQAAKRFLDQLSQAKRESRLEVIQAAQHVIYSRFGEAQDLETLKNYLREAETWLQSLLQEGQTNRRVENLRAIVSKTLVLATDTSDQSRVELCSTLRKLECSQVAVKIIEPVIKKDPKNTYALTTFGAALIDIREPRKAQVVLTQVLKINPRNPYALTALSRAYSELDEPRRAHECALNAFQVEINDFTAHRLLSSAAVVEDNAAFENALAAIQESLDHQNELLSHNVLILSAEELVDGEKVEAASKAIRELLKLTWSGEQAKRVGRLRRWLVDINKPRLL